VFGPDYTAGWRWAGDRAPRAGAGSSGARAPCPAAGAAAWPGSRRLWAHAGPRHFSFCPTD
jgi:hypothetical protein